MDGEVSEEDILFDALSSRKPMTYAEFFEAWFPFYLSIGMTYDQYWKQRSDLVIPYTKAYMMKRDEKNFFAWLQGAYVYEAFHAVMSNFGAGLSGKTSKAAYSEEPRPIRAKTEEELEQEAMDKRRKFVAALNRFHRQMESKQNAEHP